MISSCSSGRVSHLHFDLPHKPFNEKEKKKKNYLLRPVTDIHLQDGSGYYWSQRQAPAYHLQPQLHRQPEWYTAVAEVEEH